LVDVRGIDLNLDRPLIYKIGTSELKSGKEENKLEVV